MISEFIRAHRGVPASIKPIAVKPIASSAKPVVKKENPVALKTENQVATKIATKLVSPLIAKPARARKTSQVISNIVGSLEKSGPAAKKVAVKKTTGVKSAAAKKTI